MQYLYGTVQEPRIRCLIQFQNHIDGTALKRAIDLSIGAVPLLACVFDGRRRCWENHAFTADDIFRLIESPEENETFPLKVLLTSIDCIHEPQLKIFLVRNAKRDTLCAIINHMICDGAGFKKYLYLLCDLYSKCEQNPDYSEKPELSGKRNLNQLLQNFSFTEKLKILFSKSVFGEPDPSMILPIKENSMTPEISIARLKKETFCAIQSFAKENMRP